MVGRDRPDPVLGLVVCAGMPRSGSTWLYNTVRLIYKKSGASVVAGWIDDLDVGRACLSADVCIVKVHAYNDELARRGAVLSSHRDIRDVVASAYAMGWVKSKSDALRLAIDAVSLHGRWSPYALYDMPYEEMIRSPRAVAGCVAGALGLHGVNLDEVIEGVSAILPPSSGGYDRASLLHPNHVGRKLPGYYKELLDPEWVGVIEREVGWWLDKNGYA